MDEIPFNRPYATGGELALIQDAMSRGHLAGDGFYTKRARQLLTDLTGGESVLLTTSCTHALEMTALLLRLGEGDEVIMPSFTFVSCANAFVLRGARPVFVDIKRKTHNIDESQIERAITDRTRAIVVVHYAGAGCEMDQIMAIAERHGVTVIEDNAHGLGGRIHGQTLGAMGAMSTLSFHETKNIQCGEGGALVLNRPEFVERAEIIREKGTNRSRFFRGQVDKYTWVDAGSSYLPSEVLAAFLVAQLERFDDIQSQRMHVWRTYSQELAQWADDSGFELPVYEPDVGHPAHIFWVLASDLEQRTRFIKHMAEFGVKCVFHYVPLHSSPMGQKYPTSGQLSVTDDVSSRLVRLPLFAGMRNSELEQILAAVQSFR
ncbi:MAG TPA: dTDP-4-amino-4,6-dideoxygalactose transaminase [Ilumatobacter sp.]|jgi:dTDP-4-amino-4,6-dideoxygalactose transaminase|nr:dTDP-4-amino-4,6-dideoxygalactose transaminase [Ilumatobacter sp.]